MAHCYTVLEGALVGTGELQMAEIIAGAAEFQNPESPSPLMQHCSHASSEHLKYYSTALLIIC
jgi:hypothetical protein